jgi:mitochondrial fission protein ELM1
MPQDKFILSDHDKSLLEQVPDFISINAVGNKITVEVQSSDISGQRRKRPLRKRKTQNDSPSIQYAYSKLGL